MKMYLHTRICLRAEIAWLVKELASLCKSRPIQIFSDYQVFFSGFFKEGFKVIVPDLVNLPPPPPPRPPT